MQGLAAIGEEAQGAAAGAGPAGDLPGLLHRRARRRANYREAVACDRDKALAFHCALQEEGIRINQQAKWFLSTAHDDAIIDETLAAADRAMATLRMSDIRLEGVSKRYGPVAAADNVDLAVAQGEFVTILGPSGSGKTTLLSLIAGLNRPTAGRIFIGGRDVTEAPAAAAQHRPGVPVLRAVPAHDRAGERRCSRWACARSPATPRAARRSKR